MTFTRDKIRKINEEMQEAMKDVAERHSININQSGNISFTENNFKVKFEVIANGGKDKMAEDYEKAEKIYDLPPLNSVITVHGDSFETVGFKPKAKKFPIIVKSRDNEKLYKMSINVVTNARKGV